MDLLLWKNNTELKSVLLLLLWTVNTETNLVKTQAVAHLEPGSVRGFCPPVSVFYDPHTPPVSLNTTGLLSRKLFFTTVALGLFTLKCWVCLQLKIISINIKG